MIKGARYWLVIFLVGFSWVAKSQSINIFPVSPPDPKTYNPTPVTAIIEPPIFNITVTGINPFPNSYTITLAGKIPTTISDPPISAQPTAAARWAFRTTLLEAGVYKFRICGTNINSVSACDTLVLIGIPPINIPPSVEIEDKPTLLMPVTNQLLKGEISDPTDEVTYKWAQTSGPTSVTLPPETTSAAGLEVINTSLLLNNLAAGRYTFTLTANDNRGGGPGNSVIIDEQRIEVLPPPSSLDIVFDNIEKLDAPVQNQTLTGRITGINTFNDKIRYTWSAATTNPSQIPLPASGYTPLGQSEFPATINLNNLAYGTYTFTLRAEDEYYPATAAIEKSITFVVEPPRSNLSIVEVALADPLKSPVIVRDASNPLSSIMINGKITGINPNTDQTRYFWSQAPGNPTQLTLPLFTEQSLGTGQSEFSAPLEIPNPNSLERGQYTFSLTAQDAYYNDEVSGELTFIVSEPVTIEAATFFSPNGDGQNDVWLVKNLIPEIGVTIMNEQGQVVYQTDSYLKTITEQGGGWNGRYNGNLVPEGAYFYVFINNLDGIQTTGSFVIIR